MSDIIAFPEKAKFVPSENRDFLELEGAGAIHFALASGSPDDLGSKIGSHFSLIGALGDLRAGLLDNTLAVMDESVLRIQIANIGKVSDTNLSSVGKILKENMLALSSPACLKRLLEERQYDVITAGSDVIGALNERRAGTYGSSLVEQLAWKLAMEGPQGAEAHLSFIDKTIEDERPAIERAVDKLSSIESRSTSLDQAENVSSLFLDKQAHIGRAEIELAEERALNSIRENLLEISKNPANRPEVSLSEILTEIVNNRESSLCLSEFDYRRLPITTRNDFQEERLVQRLLPGEGVLADYKGQGIDDKKADSLSTYLQKITSVKQGNDRLSAIGANILRRNMLVVGSSGYEALSFLEEAKQSVASRQKIDQASVRVSKIDVPER